MVKTFRRRYIVFKVTGEERDKLGFDNLVWSVKKSFDEAGGGILEKARPWIIRFDGENGILRCSHLVKKEAISVMNSTVLYSKGNKKIDAKIKTVGTSGTIKRATTKFFSKSQNQEQV
jgi:RNase P/RNase MRP subunit POP5